MALPIVLGGCQGIAPNEGNPKVTPVVMAGHKAKSANAVVADSGGGSSSNYQSSGYPSIYAYETHKSEILTSITTNVTAPSNAYINHDVGVKVYGTNTSNTIGSTGSLKINQACPFFDFTDGNYAVPSAIKSKMSTGASITSVLLSFKVTVKKNGSTYFHAGATVNLDSSNNVASVTYDKNGSYSYVTPESGATALIDFSKIGKVASSLYSGDYTIYVEYSYFWIYQPSTSSLAIVKTTATSTASLKIDYTKPSITMQKASGSTSIANGSYTNGAVMVKASDDNYYGLYHKDPGKTSYTYTSNKSYTTGTTNGWYSFYVTDSLGNKSDELTVYIDTIKPTGQLLSNGKSVSTGSYTDQPFSFTASDSGSGISKCYYKSPNSNSYAEYSFGSIVPNTGKEGWYYFYAVDKAGNVSSTYRIYLETSKPTLTIKRNGTQVYTDAIEGGENINTGIYFNEGDTIRFNYSSTSGVCTPSGFAVNTNITLSKSSYPASTYSESITTATGKKATYKFNIVHSNPAIEIDGTRYESGANLRFKDDQTLTAKLDSVITSGSNSISVTKDGNVANYDALKTKSLSLASEEGEESKYSIALKDATGNTSNFTVIIDKKAADGQWMSGSEIIDNGSYVNKPVSFSFDEGTATASKDGGVATDYVSGTEIKDDGTYAIVLKDDVGNVSEFRITIDTVDPTGTIYVDNQPSDDGIVTNKPIYFTWDGDDTCKVNGQDYQKNSVIDEEGDFTFALIDKAGNSTTYHAVIDRTAPSVNKNRFADDTKDSTPITKWFEVNFEGETKDFESKDEALEYAKSKERDAYVKEKTLDGLSSFTETGRVAKNDDPNDDADEPRTGTYWAYKSKSNPDVELYYFDEDLLDDVLTYYASKYVSDAVYSDGNTIPSGVNGDSWDYEGTDGKIANEYVLQKDDDAVKAVAVLEGTEDEIPLAYGEKLGNQLTESGVYTIFETDEAGNVSTYQVIIDHRAPGLNIKTSTYDSDETSLSLTQDTLPASGAFYLKSLSVSSIVSGDSWAVVEVKKDDVTSRYIQGDALPTLTEGGKYEIRVYDRLGHALSFTAYISDSEEEVTFSENADHTAVSISIGLPESYEALTSIEIYKNGTKLDGVSTDRLNYKFSKGGTYRVVLKDNFGRTVTREYEFHKALPQGTLDGVKDGEKTNHDVTLSYDSDKYFAEVYKDGELYRLDSSGSLTIEANEENSGHYEIRLINSEDEENVNVYSFDMDLRSPDVSLSGVIDGGTTNGDVTVSWKDSDVASATYSLDDGEETAFSSDIVFDKEGHYVIKITDDMGNVTERSFTIDKTVDYSVTTSSGRKIGGDATTSEDVVISSNEDAKVTVIKDGETYPYEFGSALSEEGSYLITLEDAYGNKTSLTIVIDKSVSFTADVADGGITNGPVTIASDEKMTIVVTKDGKPYEYSLGDEISEEGLYKVTMTDAYGNSKELAFQIVHSDPRTSLDYSLGDGCTITSVTKDGEEIGFDGNAIAFTEDGRYVVTYVQDGKAYSFEVTLDTTAPEIALSGVEDGGRVDGTVTLSDMTEEGTVEVYKDGEKIDYQLGDELSDYGHYEVVVKDKLGNARTYTFDLAFQMNGWAIALIAIASVILFVGVFLVIANRKKIFKKK